MDNAAETERSYNRAGESFEHFSGSPSHRLAVHTVMNLAGDLRGKTVLDMGCGQGVFVAEAAKRGAARILGVDISEKMLSLAREKTAGGSAIAFLKADISAIGALGRFDKVLAVFSFIYAENTAALDAMFAAAARNLKPGGQLILYTVSPDYRLEKGAGEKYKPFILQQRAAGGGDHICRVSFDGSLARSFVFRQWSRRAYERGLQKAGFAHFFWHDPMLTEEDIYSYPPGFWDDHQNNMMQRALVCFL